MWVEFDIGLAKLRCERNVLRYMRVRFPSIQLIKLNPIRFLVYIFVEYNLLSTENNMPYKDPEKQKAAAAKHYQKKKKLYRENIKKRQKECKEYSYNVKSDKGCYKCDEKDPVCLDFHHTDSSQKIDTIANLIRRGTLSRIKTEIDKCVVLCSNCHKIEHYNWADHSEWNVPQKRKNKRDWYIELKKTLKCSICKNDDHRVLEFHHIDKDTKLFTISRMISGNTSVATILEEMSKCDILCANCHRKHHAVCGWT